MSRSPTHADIEAKIESKFFFTANDGVLGSRPGFEVPGELPEIPEGFSRITFCVLTLHNGSRATGINYGSVDSAKFSEADAQHFAYEDAISVFMDRPALWPPSLVADQTSGKSLGAALGAGAAQVTIGRLVHYVLSLDDAAKINGRRTDGAAIQDRILEDRWPIGAQAHIGNRVAPGDVLPAMVVRVLPGEQVNLQVFLDGNDVFWATTRSEAAPGRTEPGRWHWPARV